MNDYESAAVAVGVMGQTCHLVCMSRLNSTLLINSPMTVSCIISRLEKRIVFRAKRLIQVLKLRFLRRSALSAVELSIYHWIDDPDNRVCGVQTIEGAYKPEQVK